MNAAVLPGLREDLSLHRGPPEPGGAPTWSLHDAARNLFFRIDWPSFEFLSRWHLGDAERVLEAVARETTLNPQAEDLAAIVQFLAENELLGRHDAAGTQALCHAAARRCQSWLQWLLHNYLFFRLPLARPDAWLARSLPWVRWIYTPAFAALSVAAFALGLVELTRQWDTFAAALVDTFSVQGLASYGATIALVKILHELGHAWTAKRYGCRVPTMGVAFLVMFPMAYTDVNDAWKLPERRRRLAVGAAGIATELALAAWATLAWTLLPEGTLRGAMLLLATTTWVSTLLVNASPFMRFDGYFLASDALDIPNLHARAFALCRWWLRERLFALGDAPPEAFPVQRRRLLLLFGYCTWIYRLVVFSGIALLVYGWFPKPLGPFLAAIEVGWFILLPPLHELRQWRPLWPKMRARRRVWLSLGLALLALWLALLPWDRRVHAQAMLRPVQTHPVFAPGPARLASLAAADHSDVAPGAPLLLLESAEVERERDALAAKTERLQWQSESAGVVPKLREQHQVVREELRKAQAELRGIGEEQAKRRLSAPFAGRFFLAHPDMRAGDWVARNQKLGTVADLSAWKADAYLPETAVGRVHIGDRARFVPETGGAGIDLRVNGVDSDATHVLPDPMLAATHGGIVLVRERKGQIVPEHAVYHVTLAPLEPYAPRTPQEVRGHLVIFGEPEAPLAGLVKSVAAVIRREAGF